MFTGEMPDDAGDAVGVSFDSKKCRVRVSIVLSEKNERTRSESEKGAETSL